MAKRSAGLLMYRFRGGALEVLLVHPGGPYWAKKDAGAWFIPKGEVAPGEDDAAAAIREFTEETGLKPRGPYIMLGSVRHKGGKVVTAWAFEGDCDPSTLTSNTFSIEWPPRTGRQCEFPEIDRADFFTVPAARQKMHPTELDFVARLESICESGKSSDSDSARISKLR
jgi:predicted NUDIX family NTP pyrophosphohydrolase